MKDSAKGGIFRVPEKIHPTGPAVLRDRTKRIVFLSGTRTPFGRVGGSLSRFSPIDLGAKAARAAIEQAGLTDGVNVIDAAIFGNGMHTSIDAHYGARHVGLKAGLSHFSTALTVNRICWSGGEAIVTGAKELLAGEAEVVLAGGYESTSQSPMVVYGAAFGFPYMSGPEARFLFKDGLNDTFINADMMETAENLARLYGITRKDADECAYESQLKASDAKVNGRLAREITPLTLTERRAERIFGEDENPRSDTTVEGLSRLRSVKPDGIHTAGNSSGIELLSWGTAGVDPHYMGIGPVPASAIALERAGLAWKDMKHIEINEAFAGQYLAVERELNLDRSKVNINGGAIALGHPLGATGARLTISLLRLGGLGLAAACIGGGQGGALIVEGY